MKKTVILLATALIALTSHAAVLTNFEASSFTVDSVISDFSSITQTANGTETIGVDNNILAGYFLPVDTAGLDTIRMAARIFGTNPNSAFSVDVFNADFSEYRTYIGNTVSFHETTTTIDLSFVSETASFTEIGGFQFTGLGGGDPLNITFSNLEAIPEPSTVTLISVIGVVFFAMRRRPASGDSRRAA